MPPLPNGRSSTSRNTGLSVISGNAPQGWECFPTPFPQTHIVQEKDRTVIRPGSYSVRIPLQTCKWGSLGVDTFFSCLRSPRIHKHLLESAAVHLPLRVEVDVINPEPQAAEPMPLNWLQLRILPGPDAPAISHARILGTRAVHESGDMMSGTAHGSETGVTKLVFSRTTFRALHSGGPHDHLDHWVWFLLTRCVETPPPPSPGVVKQRSFRSRRECVSFSIGFITALNSRRSRFLAQFQLSLPTDNYGRYLMKPTASRLPPSLLAP